MKMQSLQFQIIQCPLPILASSLSNNTLVDLYTSKIKGITIKSYLKAVPLILYFLNSYPRSNSTQQSSSPSQLGKTEKVERSEIPTEVSGGEMEKRWIGCKRLRSNGKV